jgi:uncharacterized protein YaiL (DUF2058 family)
MSNSLKDQLLALGLAPKKSKPEPGDKPKVRNKPARTDRQDKEISLDQAYRMRVKEERLQQERAVELKRQQERERRQTNQKISALVKEHSVRNPSAENKRNFIYKGRIRSVLATPEQITEINSGKLGVVYLSGNYHLLPSDRIEEIRQFAPDHIPDLSGADQEDEGDHPVPDDLIW